MASNYKFSMFISVFILYIFAIGLASKGRSTHNYSSIGVCHESLERSPEEVVSIYKLHGINKMRLYEPNPLMLNAIRNSGIQILLGVSNDNIEHLASSYDASKLWIERNIMIYWPDVQFRYIAVGNQSVYVLELNAILKAMKNLYKVLIEVGLERHIKISTVVWSWTSMIDAYIPSQGAFAKHANLSMTHIVHFLDKIGSPLLVDVFPYRSFLKDPRIPLSYALMTSEGVFIMDGQFKYTNLFDAILDTFHVAIKRAGARRVSIVVSATGWPFDGHDRHSSVHKAEIYYLNLIKHVSSSQGTPMQRGINIETYLSSMFGIDKKLLRDAP